MKKMVKVIATLLSVVLITCTTTFSAAAKNVEFANSGQLSYSSIENLSDGGKIYTYIVDGITMQYPVPPDDFDPLSATDEELATYAFPPRPSDTSSEAYQEWYALMKNYSQTDVPEISIEESLLADTSSALSGNENSLFATSTNTTNSYISGYSSSITATTTYFYTQAQTDYTEPTIVSGNPNGDESALSCYVGIGGINSAKCVAAGTRADSTNTHWAWYALGAYGSDAKNVKITSFPVSAGNKIHVYISFQASSGKFNYYFANNTTGHSASAVVTASTSTYFDGSTVTWLIDRPGYTYNVGTMSYFTYSSLAKFNSFSITNCKATLSNSSTWVNLGDLSGLKKITMKNGSNTLCTPGIITSGTQFSLLWNGYK